MSAENTPFLYLLDRILPGLCDSGGGFDYSAIDLVFTRYGVVEGQYPVLFDKAVAVIAELRRAQAEQREKMRNK